MTTANQVLVQEEQPDKPSISKRIAVGWDAVVNFLVPIGYEDESGFYYGGQPVPHGSAAVKFDF